MVVENIMSKTVVTIAMDDSLKVIKEIFDYTGFHHLLVIESDELVGVISDRDYLRALSPNIGTVAETIKDVATLNKKAHQIMTRKPVTLFPRAGLHDAIKIFNNHKISCVPIVDEDYKPVGILSWRDIFKVLESSQDKHQGNTIN